MTLEQRCIVVFLILLTTEYSVECGSFSFQSLHPRNRQILEHKKQRLEQQMAETSTTTTVVTTSETTTTTMSTTTTTTTTTTLSSISSKVKIENSQSGSNVRCASKLVLQFSNLIHFKYFTKSYEASKIAKYWSNLTNPQFSREFVKTIFIFL